MKLRNYQIETVNQILNANNNLLCCLPTGTGKSVIIQRVVEILIGQGKVVGIVVPSIELLENLKKYFFNSNKKWIVQLMSDKEIKQDKFIYLGVYKTFQNKKHLLPDLDILIHDECHHTASKTWQDLMSLTKNIGFSATPFRLDGKPLPFDDIYEPYTIGWYMDNGYLCSNITEYIGEELIVDDTNFEDLEKQWQQAKNYTHGEFLRDWQKYNNGKTIVYACNIQHCEILKEQYNQVVPTEAIHSKMTVAQRKQVFQNFEKGKIQVLINVNTCIEGIDVPDATTVQFARFFGNIGSYSQAIGRVLRPYPNKSVVVIDNAGNLTHGSIKYLVGWKELFYEAFKYEQKEEIINEFKKLALPVPKFISSKPIGSENLIKYNLSRFEDAIVKALKKKSGSQMIVFWTSFMKQYKVNEDEFEQILKVCGTVMSAVKARRILSEFI